MARPIWKGNLTFGLLNIPVTLHAAESRSELQFNLLDRRNMARVRYERVNEATGEVVPWEEVVKAYALESGRYVTIEDEDFEKAAVQATRDIEISNFVDGTRISAVYYEKPYYLLPQAYGERAYVLLREALRRTGMVGAAQVVIRTRQSLAAVYPLERALVLDAMRFHQELRSPEAFELPGENLADFRVTDREVKMAVQLIEAMAGEWKPEQYRDEYREALTQWIGEKARMGEMAVPPAAEEEGKVAAAEVVDILDVLKRSVEVKGRGAGRKAAYRQRRKEPVEKKRRRKAG